MAGPCRRARSFTRPRVAPARHCRYHFVFCRHAARRKYLNAKLWQGDVSMKKLSTALAAGLTLSTAAVFTPALSTSALADEECNIPPPVVKNLQAKLANVVNLADANGGLFKPNRMWSAVVDRQGVLCSVVRSDPDAWPGSRAIAMA